MSTQSESTYFGFTFFFPRSQHASTHRFAKTLAEQIEYLFCPLSMSFIYCYVAFSKNEKKISIFTLAIDLYIT